MLLPDDKSAADTPEAFVAALEADAKIWRSEAVFGQIAWRQSPYENPAEFDRYCRELLAV